MTRMLQLSQNDQSDDDCAKEHIQQLEQQIDALTQNNNDTKEDLVKMEDNVNEMRRELNEMRRELRNALQKMMDMRKSIATEPAD